MRKYSLLYASLVGLALLAVIHLTAESFYLYWIIWWLDYASHFIGGLSLGFLLLYIFYESSFFKGKISLSKAIFISFILAVIVGITWEIFEYANGLTQSTEKYSLDVAHDLLADALGTILALLIARRFLKSS